MLNLVKVHFTHHILCAKIHIFIQITKLLGIFLVRIYVESTSNLCRTYVESTPLLHRTYALAPFLPKKPTPIWRELVDILP